MRVRPVAYSVLFFVVVFCFCLIQVAVGFPPAAALTTTLYLLFAYKLNQYSVIGSSAAQIPSNAEQSPLFTTKVDVISMSRRCVDSVSARISSACFAINQRGRAKWGREGGASSRRLIHQQKEIRIWTISLNY